MFGKQYVPKSVAGSFGLELMEIINHKGIIGHWEFHENWPNPDYQAGGKATAPGYVFISSNDWMIRDYVKA
jgi:hypothetical protein